MVYFKVFIAELIERVIASEIVHVDYGFLTLNANRDSMDGSLRLQGP